MGLETVVRPIENRDFRPTPKQLLEPSDDNEFILDGGDGSMLSLRHSINYSWSHTAETEVRRKFDVDRIHNPDDDEQFVDVERITQLRVKDAKGKIRKLHLARPPAADNITTVSTDNVRINNG